jgi:hypothetical protein
VIQLRLQQAVAAQPPAHERPGPGHRSPGQSPRKELSYRSRASWRVRRAGHQRRAVRRPAFGGGFGVVDGGNGAVLPAARCTRARCTCSGRTTQSQNSCITTQACVSAHLRLNYAASCAPQCSWHRGPDAQRALLLERGAARLHCAQRVRHGTARNHSCVREKCAL